MTAPERQLLRKAVDEKGVSFAEASRYVGKSHAYVSQFIQGRTEGLSKDARAMLSALTGLTEKQFGKRKWALGDPESPVEAPVRSKSFLR